MAEHSRVLTTIVISQVEMKDFADLTNTSVRDARAQWKDLSSRLMELPRLPGESASSEQRGDSEEVIQDYIVVKDEADDVSAAEEADGRKKEDERKARREARTRSKAKQAAKPSILDSLEADLDGEDSIEVTNNTNAKGNRNGVIDSPNSGDSTIQAWADIGDGSKQLSDTILNL